MERNTSQRRAIQRVLQDAARPMGPREILDAARRHIPGLGIATVYRTIKRCVDEGTLHPVELPGEPPRYEPAGKNHHHHFRCRGCNRVYEVRGCPKNLSTLTPPGFRLEDHSVVLYGLCVECTPGG